MVLRMIKYLKKYQDIIAYIFFGGMTTLVNLLSYYICAHILKISIILSVVIAWILSVLFAYVTNRKWVFHSNNKEIKDIIKEVISFFGCRLATGLVDLILMFIFVDVCHFNDLVIKIGANIIVIILNYVASKLIVFTDKKGKNEWIKIISVVIFLFILTFLLLLNSPINVWKTGNIFTDQGVFETIGFLMQKGYMPYRDTFDHKGPLIYLYNFWGQQIKYYKGIWYIEFINMFITLLAMYKIARFKCNRLVSLLLVIISTIVLFNCFEEGNLTEEYALPYICLSLYIFLDYLLYKKINNFRLMACGFSLGAVLLLRPNMISLWIVFCIAILIDCIKEKKYHELMRFIIYFMIGLLIIVVPIIIWLGVNGALSSFWNQYIIFNFKYIRMSEEGIGFLAKIKAFVMYSMHIISVVSIISIVALCIWDKKKINNIYFLYIIITLVLISISGNYYAHYGMILLPLAVYPLSVIIEYNNKYVKYVLISILLYLLVAFCIPNYYKIVASIPYMYKHRNEEEISLNIKNLVFVIDNNSLEDDTISVYGNTNILYVLSKRRHATKYSYVYPISKYNPEIKVEYFKSLKEEEPKIIVIINMREDDDIRKFINDNDYMCIYNDFHYSKVYKLIEASD